MNALYIKLGAAALVVVLIVSTWMGFQSKNRQIAELTRTVKASEVVIANQKETIRAITETRAEVQRRLVEAETAAAEAKARVVVRIKRVPAAPVQCEPAIDWLRNRAIELQKDSK